MAPRKVGGRGAGRSRAPRGRSLVFHVQLGLVLVAPGVIWWRSYGIARARELNALERQRKTGKAPTGFAGAVAGSLAVSGVLLALPALAGLAIGGGLILYALTGGPDFGAGVWSLLASGPRKAAQRDALHHRGQGQVGSIGGQQHGGHRASYRTCGNRG
mgnify:CR=1 FL=1